MADEDPFNPFEILGDTTIPFVDRILVFFTSKWYMIPIALLIILFIIDMVLIVRNKNKRFKDSITAKAVTGVFGIVFKILFKAITNGYFWGFIIVVALVFAIIAYIWGVFAGAGWDIGAALSAGFLGMKEAIWPSDGV